MLRYLNMFVLIGITLLGISFAGLATHNHFYGGQVGIAGTLAPAECVLLEAAFKVALGETVEDLNIAGAQVRTRAAGTGP